MLSNMKITKARKKLLAQRNKVKSRTRLIKQLILERVFKENEEQSRVSGHLTLPKLDRLGLPSFHGVYSEEFIARNGLEPYTEFSQQKTMFI